MMTRLTTTFEKDTSVSQVKKSHIPINNASCLDVYVLFMEAYKGFTPLIFPALYFVTFQLVLQP